MAKYYPKISTDIPFLLVKTEPFTVNFIQMIDDMILTNHRSDKIIDRTDIKIVLSMTKILIIPSLVDETYCRVVSEGLMNGIPIIITGFGNIKYLLSDAGIIVDPFNIDKWIEEISKLYNDKKTLH